VASACFGAKSTAQLAENLGTLAWLAASAPPSPASKLTPASLPIATGTDPAASDDSSFGGPVRELVAAGQLQLAQHRRDVGLDCGY